MNRLGFDLSRNKIIKFFKQKVSKNIFMTHFADADSSRGNWQLNRYERNKQRT